MSQKMTTRKTILILEDDIPLCKGIQKALTADGRALLSCHSISGTKAELRSGEPDLFILDINLPDGSGLDFCKELRSAGYSAPVLMLTANDTELDMVVGLESGADDYVTKPFSTMQDAMQDDRAEKLMLFCETPKTREEMQQHIGITNRDYFRKAYLNPLLKSGRLLMTLSDKPNSRYQKYIKA
jgi:CheY-like chemotaxis protein